MLEHRTTEGSRLFLSDPDVTLLWGDVLDCLRSLSDESVDCCVTSPPYWGLRDYGQEGQLGLEPTPEEYVTRMVEVFREVRRVLASHGTVWLNLGDSYNAYNGGAGPSSKLSQTQSEQRPRLETGFGLQCKSLKPKDLVGIPWRVAFALQADGWYLRSDIIWAKPNPMPESVTDRPTKAHEYVFLLSKQPRYFFDQEAVREASVDPESLAGYSRSISTDALDESSDNGYDGHRTRMGIKALKTSGKAYPRRNIRSVWEIATQPYPEAHFATFPEELARRCIAAGTSERGKCPECGAPWVREVETTKLSPSGIGTQHKNITHPRVGHTLGANGPTSESVTIGWHPTCECGEEPGAIGQVGTVAYSPIPAVVLDPFVGSGTVAFVARKLGRRAVGIDLNESYLDLAARRLQQQSLFAESAT